ncbi:unnamed protein product [Gongylonema pulchrum]|uniref:Phosphomevalonate kinase n=1 Tax=Gongylonema pulchrum TaxID=637853 RepID=A0A183ECQ4_9BILA|nr:unnamed protein product [Gongylonema pulchrum]
MFIAVFPFQKSCCKSKSVAHRQPWQLAQTWMLKKLEWVAKCGHWRHPSSLSYIYQKGCGRRESLYQYSKYSAFFLIVTSSSPSVFRLLRVESSEAARKLRGFSFVTGIDDQLTECGLDDFNDWNYVITNDIPVADEVFPKNLNRTLSSLCSEIEDLLIKR